MWNQLLPISPLSSLGEHPVRSHTRPADLNSAAAVWVPDNRCASFTNTGNARNFRFRTIVRRKFYDDVDSSKGIFRLHEEKVRLYDDSSSAVNINELNST
jgi:hypothetical protein